MGITNNSGDSIFDGRSVPIVVMNNEHDGSSRYGHSHSFYEFVYIERGFSLHMYNNVTTILTPGDLFAIRPGDIHDYTSANHTYLYNCLFFSEALGNMMEEIMELPGVHQVFDKEKPSVWKRIHLDLPVRIQVVDYLEKMKWERINKGPGWELKLKSLLIAFLIQFSRAYIDCYMGKECAEPGCFKYVYNALSFIEKNYKESISVNDIASVTGLSGDYISRQFKHFTGMNLIEYIRNFRFAKAVELLKDPSVAISEVAAEVGFVDQCYFTRQFKNLLGMNPTEYRKSSVK